MEDGPVSRLADFVALSRWLYEDAFVQQLHDEVWAGNVQEIGGLLRGQLFLNGSNDNDMALSDFLEGDRTVICEANMEIKAIHEQCTEQRTPACCQHLNLPVLFVPDDGGLMNGRFFVDIIGEIGIQPIDKRKGECRNSGRRKGEKAIEASVYDKFYLDILAAGKTENHTNMRLPAEHTAGDHGVVRVSAPPIAKTAL